MYYITNLGCHQRWFIDFVIHNMGLKVMHVILTPGLSIGGWEWPEQLVGSHSYK